MSQVKMIFFDIDGTLLSTTTGQISASTRQALADAKAQGIRVFIASGRHLNFVKNNPFLGSFGFDGYVTLNGGYCVVGTQVVHHTPIDKRDMRAAMDYITAHDATCVFCERHILYVGPDMRTDHAGVNSNNAQIENLDRVLCNDIYQLSFLGEAHREQLQALMPNTVTTSWAGDGFDVVAKTTNKLVGVEQVAAHYGIDMSQVAAIGDGENDIEMLQGVGWGIAMGNAEPAVKAVARHVSADIEADGVSQAVSYLLNQG